MGFSMVVVFQGLWGGWGGFLKVVEGLGMDGSGFSGLE